MRLPRRRFTIRRMMVAVALTAVMMAYVGSYYRLSRRGMREAVRYGMPAFLYVSAEEAATAEGQSRHYTLSRFYFPLNWLDRTLLGGPWPRVCFLRLSG